jgi:hypothetical protein
MLVMMFAFGGNGAEVEDETGDAVGLSDDTVGRRVGGKGVSNPNHTFSSIQSSEL